MCPDRRQRDAPGSGSSLASCSVGISASDFDTNRGYMSSEVYQLVDFIEYGGYFSPRDDPGVISYLERFPGRIIGRHLVFTEVLSPRLDKRAADRIRRDIREIRVDYLVTDFGFWHFGGSGVGSLLFRPCTLSQRAAKRISRNVSLLQDWLGLPLFIENPFSLYFEGNLDMVEFLNALVVNGVSLCLDIGHLIAAYSNTGISIKKAFLRLPFEAIKMCHVAGLSHVKYGKKNLLLDNHNVPPSEEALECLRKLKNRAHLQRVVYEAELAPTDVQLEGLYRLGRG
jgi:uncharacterized protein (UPF0276 family)